jgi:hypothetical protein
MCNLFSKRRMRSLLFIMPEWHSLFSPEWRSLFEMIILFLIYTSCMCNLIMLVQYLLYFI